MRWPRLPLARRRHHGPRAGHWADVAPALVALAANSTTSLVAGLALGALTDTFTRLPGLLVLVPAAIGLRGNVFSALGSRLSTAVHAGTLVSSRRRGTLLVENLLGAMVLTSGVSLALAVGAWFLARLVLPVAPIPLLDLATISIAGGLLASAVVLVVTVGLALAAARRHWDLDDLVAPVVSTLGDVLTLPALALATLLVDHGWLSTATGLGLTAATLAASAAGLASHQPLLRSVCRQSWPVLVAAGGFSLLAGLVIEHHLETLTAAPALLVLVPAFVSSAGALGGILAARVATGLHLGTRTPRLVRDRATRSDMAGLALLALPVMAYNAVGASALAPLVGPDRPTAGPLLVTALLAGVGAVGYALLAATASADAAVRLRLDPDTVGIPLVTSTVDVVGAFLLTTTAVLLGIVST